MGIPVAPDDIVQTPEQGEANSRPPCSSSGPWRAFLDAHGIGGGEIVATPIGDGHSNVTYLIERGGSEVVLRRPPRPPLPPSAHDVLREARLLRALQDTRARVPKVLAVGSDEVTIGAPFYVMERVVGDVIVASVPRAAGLSPRAQADRRAADRLARGDPLGRLARRRPGGLRQTHRLPGTPAAPLQRPVGAQQDPRDRRRRERRLVARRARPRQRPRHDRARRLPARQHDLRPARRPAHLEAVLDWEMATIGDPLADVGYLCMMWTEPSDPEGGLREHLGRVTRAEGFPTRAELIARYEEGSGRSMRDVRWYTTLALWKSIVFMEGNYKRALAGTTDDPYLKTFGDGVLELARQARGGGTWNGRSLKSARRRTGRPRRERGGRQRAVAPSRAADRLGRGAHDQPVRLLPRLLRARRNRPGEAGRALQNRPGGARAADRAGDGQAGRGRVRAPLRRAARRRPRRADRRPLLRRSPRRADGRRGPPGPPGGGAHGAGVELLGRAPLPPLDLRRALRRRRDLGRRGHPQALQAHVRARRRARRRRRRRSASTWTTCPST